MFYMLESPYSSACGNSHAREWQAHVVTIVRMIWMYNKRRKCLRISHWHQLLPNVLYCTVQDARVTRISILFQTTCQDALHDMEEGSFQTSLKNILKEQEFENEYYDRLPSEEKLQLYQFCPLEFFGYQFCLIIFKVRGLVLSHACVPVRVANALCESWERFKRCPVCNGFGYTKPLTIFEEKIPYDSPET